MEIKLYRPFKESFSVTQEFGENPETYKWIKDVFGNPIKGHDGTDYGYGGQNSVELFNPFPKGNEVVVSRIGWDEKGYGWFIRIWDKTQKFVILMAHCREILVKEEDNSVSFKQLVAYGDNTGWSTGPHLHLAGYFVNSRGYKQNRANGYDGYVNLLDKDSFDWLENEQFNSASLRDTLIDWDDEEGNRHDVEFYTREWFNEKEQNLKLAEEVAKWREMQESCQNQVATMAQEATERMKLIDYQTLQLKTKERAILELQGINKTMSDNNETLKTTVENLQKKNDLKQYSVGQLIFEVFSRIKRGEKK